jgi:hypothetical protein
MEWMVVGFFGSQRGALVSMKLLHSNHGVKNSISRRYRITYGNVPVCSWSHWLALGWMGHSHPSYEGIDDIANIDREILRNPSMRLNG